MERSNSHYLNEKIITLLIKKGVAASLFYINNVIIFSLRSIVCNTSGPPMGSLLDVGEEAFLQTFQNHVLVNSLLAQELVPRMRASGYGRIINIISTSVKAPIPQLGVSNTIRAAVANWAKTLSFEVGKWGITVNNVLPGYTETSRLQSLISARTQKLQKSEEEVRREWIEGIPLGRIGQPEEIAKAVAFLASPAAAYISGINLPVDGGRTTCL